MSSKLEPDVCCRLQVAPSGKSNGGNRRPGRKLSQPTAGSMADSLYVTCGLTACTPGSPPGPTLGNEYGKNCTCTYTDNMALPAFAKLHAVAAATDRYLLPTGPTAASHQQRVCCCDFLLVLGQTDGPTSAILLTVLHILGGHCH